MTQHAEKLWHGIGIGTGMGSSLSKLLGDSLQRKLVRPWLPSPAALPTRTRRILATEKQKRKRGTLSVFIVGASLFYFTHPRRKADARRQRCIRNLVAITQCKSCGERNAKTGNALNKDCGGCA